MSILIFIFVVIPSVMIYLVIKSCAKTFDKQRREARELFEKEERRRKLTEKHHLILMKMKQLSNIQ